MAQEYLARLGYVVNTKPLDKGTKSLKNLTDAGNKTEKSVSSVNRAVGVLSAGISALAASAIARDVIQYSDAWTQVDNQLRVVIDSEEELIQKRTQLIQLSKDTNASLSSTTALYAELYRNTRDVGTSDEQLIKVTRTLNNLFVAGGKDAQTQAGAIRQLSQALGTGALRGDEYISVTEAAPRIIDALADSLGMAKGEMRDFAATGGITSNILINAISSYSTEAQRMADATAKTFAQSWQNAQTNLMAYIGASGAALAATQEFGSVIEVASENIGALVDGAQAAASIMLLAAAPAAIKYAASVAMVAKNQLLAGTTATTKYNPALMMTTTVTASATVATNALGMATRFLLGPWGLLLTALGTAATAFSISKSNSEELTESLDKQAKKAQQLQDVYSAMSKQQLSDAAISTRKRQIELDQQILDVQRRQEEVQKRTTGSIVGFDVNEYNKLTQELNGLLEQREKVNEMQKSIVQAFNMKIPTQWEKPVKEAAKAFGELHGGMDMVSREAINQSNAYDRWIQSIYQVANVAENLEMEISDVWDAMLGGDLNWDVGLRRISQLQDQLKAVNEEAKKTGKTSGELFSDFAAGASQGLSAIRDLSEDGSKAYRDLTIAIQAMSAAQAFATGNIAGGIASAISGLSMLSKDIVDNSAEIQASQNLDAFGEKADSIAVATETSASASERLVGINTKMLSALTNLQSALFAAAGIVQRESSGVGFSTPNLGVIDNVFEKFLDPITFKIADTLTLGLFGKIGGLLGGSSKVTNSGIRIIGGAFNDMMSDVTVQAFQEIKYKKWRFGSTKRKTQFADLGNEAGNQIALVFGSIGDSVAAGAEALGISQTAIERAFSKFRVGTASISLKDLSSVEQQEEINAYFSGVFNDLATVTIPFLQDLQQAGEELGETMARAATQVNILELLGEQLGVTIGSKLANPEMFAKAADNLATLTGGVENLSTQTSSFINAFASDEQKILIYSNSLSESLEAVGLSLPSTTQGMWDLMSGLDATTESGREQIATLLGISESAQAYYSLLDNATAKYSDAAQALYEMDEATRQVTLSQALSAARAGDMSLAEDLDLSNIGPSESDFASSVEFGIARALAASQLSELQELNDGSLSVEEQQLTTLREIRDSLQASGTMSQQETVSELKEMKEESAKQGFMLESLARNAASTASMLSRIEGAGLLTYTEGTA